MDAFCFPGTSLAAMVTGLGAHTERAMTATVCITRPFLQRPGASASLAQSEPWNPFARGTRACRLAVQRPMGPNSYVFFFACLFTTLDAICRVFSSENYQGCRFQLFTNSPICLR